MIGKKLKMKRQQAFLSSIFLRLCVLGQITVLFSILYFVGHTNTSSLSYTLDSQYGRTSISAFTEDFPNSDYLEPKVVFWNGGFNDPIDDDAADQGQDIAIDTEGDLLVSGFSFHITYGMLPLLKYSPIGELFWNCTVIENTENDTFIGNRLVVDAQGNSFICGYSFNSERPAYVWKVNFVGDVLWNATFQGGEMGAMGLDIAIDSEKNIILVGVSNHYFPDIFMCKFDPNGSLLWNTTFGHFGLNDWAYGLAIDSNDNYYLVGDSIFTESNGSNHRKLVSYKFSSDGTLLWNQTIDIVGNARAIHAILSTDERSLFIVGDIWLGQEKAWDAIICKLATKSGALQWYAFWGGEWFETAWDVALDASGDLLVTGDTESYSAGGGDLFLIKVSAKNGAILWQYTWGAERNDRGCGIAYSSSENGGTHLYITGDTNSFGHTSGDILLLIFDDSDNDGLTDAWEEGYGTDPFQADSDQDGLSDFLEVDKYLTDPLDSDSDDDGWLDGQEVWWRTNPLEPKSNPGKRKAIIFSTIIPTLALVAFTLPTFFLIKRKRKVTQ